MMPYRVTRDQWVNSSPPGATYMHQWTGSALVQVMAWCRRGDKPLPELMVAYCELDSWEQFSVKFESEFYHFHSRNCIWNCRLPIWRPFCPGGDELRSCLPIVHQAKQAMNSIGIIVVDGGFIYITDKEMIMTKAILQYTLTAKDCSPVMEGKITGLAYSSFCSLLSW